ncbi:MAG: hypothetical protein WBW71_15130, partial [Bacteroidota bacterium]
MKVIAILKNIFEVYRKSDRFNILLKKNPPHTGLKNPSIVFPSLITKKVFFLLIVFCSVANSQWKPEGIPVMDTSTSSGYLYPEIVTDDKGGCYVIWGDPRNQTDINIFVQHLDH